MLFPLPLVPFEEYMLCDDRASYPMSGIVRLRFAGFLVRDALEAAVGDVVRRHVLMRATVRRERGRRPCWIDHPDWVPAVHWQAATNRYGFPPAARIDLTREPGTRVWVVDREAGHELVVQVHHVAADALGLNRLFEDLLLSYAIHLGAADPASLPELEPRLLAQRGAPELTAGRFLRMAHHQAVGLLGVREFLFRRPVPLTGKALDVDPAQPPPAFPCPLTASLTVQETAAVLATAKSLGVTVNDLLVRDLFLAVGAWRGKHGMGGERDWLRVSIPMNLRRPGCQRMPMANSVSMVFLDRRPMDLGDPDQLLRGLHRQMQIIRRHQLQYTFTLSLGLSRLLPGGLSRQTRSERCHSSSCFSNLGPVFSDTPLPRQEGRIVAGNVVLEAIDHVIPLRPHLHAAIVVSTYAGRLQVVLHFDARSLSDDLAAELLEDFLACVRRSAGGARQRGARQEVGL